MLASVKWWVETSSARQSAGQVARRPVKMNVDEPLRKAPFCLSTMVSLPVLYSFCDRYRHWQLPLLVREQSCRFERDQLRDIVICSAIKCAVNRACRTS